MCYVYVYGYLPRTIDLVEDVYLIAGIAPPDIRREVHVCARVGRTKQTKDERHFFWPHEWKVKAEQEKEQHKLEFPDWKYKVRSKRHKKDKKVYETTSDRNKASSEDIKNEYGKISMVAGESEFIANYEQLVNVYQRI